MEQIHLNIKTHMIQIRGSLTRLKRRVEETLPEGDDIFGFPGVTKAGILEMLNHSYTLTGRIEQLRGQFPIVALKRKLRPDIDECRAYLGEDDAEKASDKNFDTFLTSLTHIHDEIALTFTVYMSESTHTESEFQAIRLQTQNLVEEYAGAKTGIDEMLVNLERVTQLHDHAEEVSESTDAVLEEVKATQKSLVDAAGAATVKAEVITKYENETKQQKEVVLSLSRQLSSMEKKLKSLLSESQDHVQKSGENLSKVAEIESMNLAQQNTIAQTLRLASKFGMAASFKERKDELQWSMSVWGAAFAIAMVGIFATGVFYIVPQFEARTITDASSALVKISLLAPLIWLGWMSAKQYGYISRIREDYSFKYASALAFEGYKKEAAEVDPKMLKDLLGVATENMSLNPLRIYGDEQHHHASPIHEIVATLTNKKDAPTAAPANGGVSRLVGSDN